MDCVDEATLLERLRQGDEAAYELLIRTYGGRMLAVARGLLRNEEDARDVVQNAYVSAFRGLPTFKGTSQLSTWLRMGRPGRSAAGAQADASGRPGRDR